MIPSLYICSCSQKEHQPILSFIPFNPTTDIDEPGLLPNISYVGRKPEPLGTEFKVVCDSETGIMIFIEIQRGKKGMESVKHNNTMLKTAACTARLIEGTRNEEESLEGLGTVEIEDENEKKKDTYYADAWFGSVDAVLAAMDRQSHLVCVVKTNTNRYPKNYIESKMQAWPPGSHLLLEAMIEFKKVYALGYKYSKKKVLCFLFSKGAGHTEEGDPYIAKWKDENGNTIRKFVKRPDVIARYFSQSNKVDMHNHARQGELQLEKAWITTNGFFRVATTLFSLTVTDCWRAYRTQAQEHCSCRVCLSSCQGPARKQDVTVPP